MTNLSMLRFPAF